MFVFLNMNPLIHP